MKKNEVIALVGLGVVAYLLFSQTSSATVPGGTVNIPGGGGPFQGPCPSPYAIGPSGCILPTGAGTTITSGGGGGGTTTDPGSEEI